MTLLGRYILRQIAVATVIATAILVFALLLAQSMRLIQVIVDGQVTAALFFRLVVLSMPELLIAVLPVGVISAILFVYNRLLTDGELLVMRGSGISQLQLAAPGLVMALLVTGCSFLLNLYLWPVANRDFRDLRALAQSDYSTALLQTGEFNAIGRTLTVYIRSRDASGDLHGILLHDTREKDRPVTMLAETGLIEEGETAPRVVMLEGMRQEFDRSTGRMQTLQFEQYAVDLDIAGPDLIRSYRQPSERFVHELLWPNPASERDRENYRRLVTEGHMRLTVPLLPFTFGALAIGILLSGDYNRRGFGLRILAAIAAIVAVEAASLGLSGATRDALELVPAMYALPALAVIAGLVLLLVPFHSRRPATGPEPAPA